MNTKHSGSQTTTDINVIKQWAAERDGSPAVVKATAKNDDGILRINFPGYTGDDTLEDISWEEWYNIFKEKNLQFLYTEKTAEGKPSRFFKLVSGD